MTPAVARFLRRIRSKAATMQPAVAKAYLAGVDALAERLSGRALEALAASGAVERYISLALSDANLGAAFSRYRAQVQLTTRDAVAWFGKDIVKTTFAEPRKIAIAFDVLSPHVVTAIRALDGKVMQTLAADIRGTVRAAIEKGLADGAGPRTTARALRDVLGLAKNQYAYVENLRTELETGKFADAARRVLIDRRFNLQKLDSLAPAERAARIDSIVNAYRKSMIAANANTVTTTATLQSFRVGQTLSWQNAIDRGIVDGSRLMKQWIQVDRPTKRESHAEMAGEVVPFSDNYSNGDYEPGDGEPWNCACQSRVFIGRGD